jgi:hypothetical protein
MSTAYIRPEVLGCLSLAAAHRGSADHWHFRPMRPLKPWRGLCRHRLVAKHRAKAQKLESRARRLGWDGIGLEAS